MTVSLDPMNNKTVRRVVNYAACIVGGILVVKLVTAAADAAHEKKQSKEIRKLKKQVAELQDRVDELEDRLDEEEAGAEAEAPEKHGLFGK